MSQDTYLQIRISEEEKEAARLVLSRMGLSLSGAVKIFLRQVVQDQRIPFPIDTEKTTSGGTKLEKPLRKAETIAEWNSFTKRKIG